MIYHNEDLIHLKMYRNSQNEMVGYELPKY